MGQIVPAAAAAAATAAARAASKAGEFVRLQRLMDEIDNQLSLIDMHHAKFEQGFDKMAKSGDGLKRLVDYTGKAKIMDKYQERLEDYGEFWKCIDKKVSGGIDAYDGHVNPAGRANHSEAGR